MVLLERIGHGCDLLTAYSATVVFTTGKQNENEVTQRFYWLLLYIVNVELCFNFRYRTHHKQEPSASQTLMPIAVS